jgi:opacity protein-like surface antigen
MSKKINSSLGLAAASLTLAGTLVSPQAAAQTEAERVADAAAKKTAALEAQVNQMATMMQAMQAELNRVKTIAQNSADNAKVQELDQWMASVKNAPVQAAAKDHLVSVRGGWYSFDHSRGSTDDGSLAGLVPGTGLGVDVQTSETDDDGFYYGGAFDFNVNNDLFGLMDNTSFGIEFGFEYTEIGDRKRNGLQDVITGTTLGVTGLDLQESVTVNMLRINASPKIKFMHGSKFRPWIIPVGLDVNIISPPSDAVTYVNTGMNFGAGAEYEILPGIVIGADGRYHWTPDDVDGVDTDGFTLGGSVGFKF